jgi:tetratricopeptide (TPR) repeat protein
MRARQAPVGEGGVRISATLIVRDEERFLPGCLGSLRGFADEMVVVDTGSKDRSPEIAAAQGANVCSFQWCDDFAAARNHALERASGNWILYIDADERIRPCDRSLIDPVLAEPETCAGLVTFFPQQGFTAYRELRLFPRRSDIRFQGAMHETVAPSIDRLLRRDGARMATTRLMIDHLGYDGGRARKHERDLRLLTKQVAVDPQRTYPWWHLGLVHHEKGDGAAAERAWSAGVDAARRSPRWPAENALCYVELAKRRVLEARYGEAFALIEEVRRRQDTNPLLDCLEARGWAATGRLHEALGTFERLAGVDAETLVDTFAYDKTLFGAGAFAEGALCLFRLGRYAESAEWYGRALRLEPDDIAFRAKYELAVQRSRATGHAGLVRRQPPRR